MERLLAHQGLPFFPEPFLNCRLLKLVRNFKNHISLYVFAIQHKMNPQIFNFHDFLFPARENCNLCNFWLKGRKKILGEEKFLFGSESSLNAFLGLRDIDLQGRRSETKISRLRFGCQNMISFPF